ncbi:MAG: carbon-nitrogen hydrolase family protein [Lentisphaerae bacterium]|nr:carbon-nitrogen hydrolase family protein [Lentisphaerota bacterium]MCP4101151.1 carbon-nitrogen hydrolase family protein [Lentisphaerota bacterium]
MSNYVTISSLGPAALKAGNLAGQPAVENMKEHWSQKLAKVLPDKPDLILLPEACDRYPDMPIKDRLGYYDVRGNQMLEFFKGKARENSCYIGYSAALKVEDGSYRNCTTLIDRKGEVAGVYSKNFVVVSETDYNILSGKNADVFETDFGKVACAICFDLNFDELRLKYVEQHPDIILFSSMYHGGMMENYWAYSCQSYFVGAICNLPCEIIDPLGSSVAKSTNYFDYVTHTVNLDCKLAHLDFNWEKFDVCKAKYGRGFKVTDPGYLGSVLISSELEDVSINDMIKEFEIELLDDFMQRSYDHRYKPGVIEP